MTKKQKNKTKKKKHGKKGGIEVQLVWWWVGELIVHVWKGMNTSLLEGVLRFCFVFLVISLPKSRQWKRIDDSQFSAVTSIASRRKSRPQRDGERRPPTHGLTSTSHLHFIIPATCSAITLEYLQRSPGEQGKVIGAVPRTSEINK